MRVDAVPKAPASIYEAPPAILNRIAEVQNLHREYVMTVRRVELARAKVNLALAELNQGVGVGKAYDVWGTGSVKRVEDCAPSPGEQGAMPRRK